MKIVTLSILLMFWAFNSNAQNTYFNKIYGDTSRVEAGYAIMSIDSNYFITGISTPAHSILPRADLTICLNQKGDTVWTRQDSLNYPVGFDIESLNNSIYEICNADFPTQQEFCLKKLRTNGDSVWTKYYPFRVYDFSMYLIPTNDSGLVIVGSISTDTSEANYVDTNNKSFIIKVDSNGNIQWIDSSLVNEYGNSAYAGIETKDHSYLLVGWYNVPDTDYNVYRPTAMVLKIDSSGHQLWYRWYPSATPNAEETACCTLQTPDNGFLVGGYTALGYIDPSELYTQYFGNWVMKIDSNGNIQWQKTYGDTVLDVAAFRQIRKTLDGNYILIGQSEHYGTDSIYAYMVKIDSTGNELFERGFYRIPYPLGYVINFAYDILTTPDSGFIFVGSSLDTTSHVWVVKTDKYGCDSVGCQNIPTGIAQIEQQNSSFSVYPNPALSQTTVLYSVPVNTQQVNLFVYDITGRQLEQIPLNKYTNQTTLDVGDLLSGMYLIELKTDDDVVVKKLVKE